MTCLQWEKWELAIPQPAAPLQALCWNSRPEAVTGRGAGLSGEGLERKIQVIQKAIVLHGPDREKPLEVLSALGGLDIAAMTGFLLGGAIYRIPVVLDGMISAVAALLAAALCPGVTDYLLPSHLGKEPPAAWSWSVWDLSRSFTANWHWEREPEQ